MLHFIELSQHLEQLKVTLKKGHIVNITLWFCLFDLCEKHNKLVDTMASRVSYGSMLEHNG